MTRGYVKFEERFVLFKDKHKRITNISGEEFSKNLKQTLRNSL